VSCRRRAATSHSTTCWSRRGGDSIGGWSGGRVDAGVVPGAKLALLAVLLNDGRGGRPNNPGDLALLRRAKGQPLVYPPPMTPKRVMINTVAVLFVLGLTWLLIQVRSIIVLLILGILFAAAIEPLVFRLRRRGLTRGQAILIVYVSLIALLSLVVYLVVPPLITQATDLIDQIPQILGDLRDSAYASDNEFIRTSGARTLNRAIAAYNDLRANPSIEGSQALSYATTVVGALFTVVSTMIVAFYWMTEKAIIKRLILGLFPLDKRDRAHALWDEIEAKLGGWTRGQLLLCLVIGVLSAIAYFIIGLDFWLALGIWAGITEIIPFIGPFLGGTAAVTVALTESWQKALIVLVFVVMLQQLEGAFLVPRVMRNAVGMTPLTVVLAVLVGGAVAGPLGSILAIPVGAATQVLVQDMLRNRAGDPDSASRSGFPVSERDGLAGNEVGRLGASEGRKV
jgi:predicted PurR-regulated permease PerM